MGSDQLRGFDDFEAKLGDELRGERATIGKSLLDVQRDLKIKASYISAIENCDPSVFPNPGFVAGYVRSYARYLKIDPDLMFERFRHESGFEGVNAGMQPGSKPIRKKQSSISGNEASRFEGYVTPPKESFLSFVSPSGIASVFVLSGLIFGLAAGGWAILNDIQRVDLVPVDQTPGVVASVNPIQTISTEFETSNEELSLNTASAEEELSTEVLGRLYRPQELSIPKVIPRDGPIAAIDPETVGSSKKLELPSLNAGLSVASEILEEEKLTPVVTIDTEPMGVELVATRAAWVRVHLEDGTVLFEKILEKGERYSVPSDAVNPLLRAGNSGSVYVLMNNETFGPVGSGTSVAKQVSLRAENIETELQIAENIELLPEPTVSTAENQ